MPTRMQREAGVWPRVGEESVPLGAPSPRGGVGTRARATVVPAIAAATLQLPPLDAQRTRHVALSASRAQAGYGPHADAYILTSVAVLAEAAATGHPVVARDLAAARAGLPVSAAARRAAAIALRHTALAAGSERGLRLGAVLGAFGVPAWRGEATSPRRRAWRDRLVWHEGSDLGPARGERVPPAPGRLDAAMADLVGWARRADVEPVAVAAVVHAHVSLIAPLTWGNEAFATAMADATLAHHGVMSPPWPVWSLGDTVGGAPPAERALAAYADGDPVPAIARARDVIGEGTAVACRVLDELADERQRRGAMARVRRGSAAAALIDSLPALPLVTAPLLSERLGVSSSAAYHAIAQLSEANVLTRVSTSRRDTVWAETSALEVIDRAARGGAPAAVTARGGVGSRG